MNIEEINRYINLGSTGDICVYRELLLPEMPHLVESIYITGGYNLIVEFDGLSSIYSGDGWSWESSTITIDDLIRSLEDFIKRPIAEWENISKTGKLLVNHCEPEPQTMSLEDSILTKKYNIGMPFLPTLPQGSHWAKTPLG